MSLRLKVFNFWSRLVVKPHFRRQTDVGKMRRHFDLTARFFFRQPPFSLFLETTYPAHPTPKPALWISSGPTVSRQIIFYVHGGGYIAGSPITHKKMLARLSRLTGLRVFAPSYGLAPENPFPAAFDDVRAAFDALLARGYAPSDIILGGDSAGGGLALALLSALCVENRPPLATFAFSPLTDITFSGQSLLQNTALEVFFPAERVEELADMVLQGHSPDDARVSPLWADFPACTPVYLQASESEILRDDTIRMAAHLAANGTEVTDDIWQDTPHVWQLFDGIIPESRRALAQTAGFIRRMTEYSNES